MAGDEPYRDDQEAALERAAALERENAQLREQLAAAAAQQRPARPPLRSESTRRQLSAFLTIAFLVSGGLWMYLRWQDHEARNSPPATSAPLASHEPCVTANQFARTQVHECFRFAMAEPNDHAPSKELAERCTDVLTLAPLDVPMSSDAIVKLHAWVDAEKLVLVSWDAVPRDTSEARDRAAGELRTVDPALWR